MTISSFVALPLHDLVQQSIRNAQYSVPTPIQAESIPHVVAGRDLLGVAQTGTGKTAAFALPILHRLVEKRLPPARHCPRVLVLAPTRELAVQINDSFRMLGRGLKVYTTVIYGGVGQGPQVAALQRGVDVLVATPGRLLDLMQQGHLKLSHIDTLVLDEADRMFDMGFLPDLKRIIAAVPEKRQSLFFSATMPGPVAQLAESMLANPARVTVTPVSSTVETIAQKVLHMAQGEKLGRLRDLLRNKDLSQVLVFTRTKHRADAVVKKLSFSGVSAGAIHGNKSQAARQRALQEFRHGRVRVLVATDIAARGIDVTGISHVINFDMPHEPENYVHRIGRTGRAGATGIALSFCDSSERGYLRQIEKLIRQSIPHQTLTGAPKGPEAAANGEGAAPETDANSQMPQDHVGPHRHARRPGKHPGGPRGTRPAQGSHESSNSSRPQYGKPRFKFAKKPGKGKARRFFGSKKAD